MNNMMSHTRRYICGARNCVIFTPGIHKPVTRFGTQPSPQHPSRQSCNQRAAKSSNGFGYSGCTGFGRCCCQPYLCRCPHHTDDRDSDTGNMPCGGDVFYCFGITVPLVSSASFSCALFPSSVRPYHCVRRVICPAASQNENATMSPASFYDLPLPAPALRNRSASAPDDR